MNKQEIHIGTARIKLTNPIYWFDRRRSFFWDIFLFETSYFPLSSSCSINLGDTLEEAEEFLPPLKNNFKEAGINNGDKVIVLYTTEQHSNNVIAISAGDNHWIDTNDKFTNKTFEELNINIGSLIAEI